jgi:hypothetical protein
MGLWLAILFILFSSPSLASEPVPGKVTKGQTQDPNQKKAQAKETKTPGKPDTGQEQKNKSPDVTKENKQKPQAVSGLPVNINLVKSTELDIKKDWGDRANLIFSGVLVLVAAFQSVLLFYTLKTNRAAVRAALRSTITARRQGNILVAIERPWVISIEPKLIWIKSPKPNLVKGPWPLPDPIDKPMDIRLSFRMVNVGNSPAFLDYFWRTAKTRPMPRGTRWRTVDWA